MVCLTVDGFNFLLHEVREKRIVMPKPAKRVENTYQQILATRGALNAHMNFARFKKPRIADSLVVNVSLFEILCHDTILLEMYTTSIGSYVFPNTSILGVSFNYSTKSQIM